MIRFRGKTPVGQVLQNAGSVGFFVVALFADLIIGVLKIRVT
jgi:hypothetical protein